MITALKSDVLTFSEVRRNRGGDQDLGSCVCGQ